MLERCTKTEDHPDYLICEHMEAMQTWPLEYYQKFIAEWEKVMAKNPNFMPIFPKPVHEIFSKELLPIKRRKYDAQTPQAQETDTE